MKVFQKILSHGLLITFFVAIFFLYLYRGALFPQWFGERAENSTSSPVITEKRPRPAPIVAPQAKQESPDRSTLGGSATESVSAQDASGLPPIVTDEERSADGGLPPLVADQAVPASESPPDQVAMEVAPSGNAQTGELAAQMEHGSPPAEDLPPVADTQPPRFRPMETPERSDQVQVDTVAPSEPVVQADKDSVVSPGEKPVTQPEPEHAAAPLIGDYQSQLAAARELFWKQDAQGSVHAYKKMLQSYPDRADGWGELGNLYIALGEKKDAADSYYQAIGLLIQQGRREEADKMLGVMQTLDAAKAEELKQWLERTER